MLIGTTEQHVEAVAVILPLVPGRYTVADLSMGKIERNGQRWGGTGLSASEIRRALGYLYGQGRALVVEVKDGEEMWAMTSSEERAKR